MEVSAASLRRGVLLAPGPAPRPSRGVGSTRPALPLARAGPSPAEQSADSGGGVGGWLGRLQASMPVVGLLRRLSSTEGGVGSDRLHYSEFCVRQERRLTPQARAALLEFQARYGQMARPGVVMFWCWVAVVGAGVLRREEVLLSARRMRASLDMEYELNLLDSLLDDPAKAALAARVSASLPAEAKAAIAAEALQECCGGRSVPVDTELLLDILAFFFPGASLEGVLPGTSQESDSTTAL